MAGRVSAIEPELFKKKRRARASQRTILWARVPLVVSITRSVRLEQLVCEDVALREVRVRIERPRHT
jgi:hypothetical protein